MEFPRPGPRTWCVTEDTFRAERAGHAETIFTLANGYYGTRGSLECAPHHGRPGSYFAGVFDLTPVHFEELVNAPNWIDLEIRTGGIPFDPATARVRSYRRILDLQQGLLFTRIRWTDTGRRTTRYESVRLVHQSRKHWALLVGRITPENWSGELVIAGGIDAAGGNTTAARHVKVHHVAIDRFEIDDLGVACEGRTVRTGLPLALRSKLVTSPRGTMHTEHGRDRLREAVRVRVRRGRAVDFTKYVALVGRPLGRGRTAPTARRQLQALIQAGPGPATASHVKAWKKRWAAADVQISGKADDQAAVRFNIFHLMQSGPDRDIDVSIAAKALHGEGYRGHVFWDTEIFMVPFFAATLPEVARALLMYRYRRLKAARRHAAESGYKGARFPWESALEGSDVTPTWPHDIPASKLIDKPNLHLQHHITADIAYAVDRYRRASGDDTFFFRYGAQLILETAQFWASRVAFDKRRRRYMIRRLQCADEFHGGVDNDAYTNYMAAENLRLGIETLRELRTRRPATHRKLCRQLGLGPEAARRWAAVLKDLHLPFDARTGLIEQFDGYFKLKNITVRRDKEGWPYVPRSVWRGGIRNTQIIKQADVVLAMFLLPDRFAGTVKRLNYRYYEARDVMGSSLSPNTYAIMGIEVGEHQRAYRAFRVSALRDLRFTGDIQGIHAACLGGTWQAAVNGFGGLRVRQNGIHLNPWLPPEWKKLAFKFLWRGTRLCVEITRRRVRLHLDQGKPLEITVQGQPVTVTRKPVSVTLKN